MGMWDECWLDLVPLVFESGTVTQEKGMEAIKLELVQKMEEKGITIPQIAEAIQFDPHLLTLYLAKDAYPVPKRIMEKLTAFVNN